MVEIKMFKILENLRMRAENHDKSKLVPPEKDGWDLMDKEPSYRYGTVEYYKKMKKYYEVFKHHYDVNSHHPEHYGNDISKMDLLDIIEMLCDWLSYKEDLTDEEIDSTIKGQCKRFNFSDEMQSILINTAHRNFSKSYFNENDIYMKQKNLFADLKMQKYLDS
jgi:hypothetical protein